MLIGQNTATKSPSSGVVVTTANFQDTVLKASLEKPVVLDLWAPWCGPCKQLMPVLEKAVESFGDTFVFATVNIDDNQEIAAALRIQSVPTVFVIYKGQPLDVFQGAMPESEIKTFLANVLSKAGIEAAGEPSFDEALAYAAEMNSAGDWQTAREIYETILDEDPTHIMALSGLAMSLIGLNDLEGAASTLDKAQPHDHNNPAYVSARAALDLTLQAGGSVTDIAHLRAQLTDAPDNFDVRFDLALALFIKGQAEDAFHELLYIIKKNRGWNDDAARKQLLKFFDQLGPTDPRTVAGRRALSSVLFS